MGLPVRAQAKYWGIAAAVIVLILMLLGDVMMPFLVGMAVAYFLDPVADRLERVGLSRVGATVTITLCALVIFVLGALLVLPTLIDQAVALANAAPDIAGHFHAFLTERFPSLADNGSTIRKTLTGIGEAVQAKGGELLNGLLTSVVGIVDLVVLIVLVPVVTFYLLMDWDRMVAEVDKLLPLDHAPVIRRLAGEVDRTLAGFIRGQGTVCLILGVFYAVALGLLGLNYGLIVGFVAGMISFVPYVGAVVGGTLALGLALFQFWGEWWMIAIAGGIFIAGQQVEGHVLTPKLVGGSVGLHPVWLIFALSAFGSLFGFVGLLAAVPVAASLGVLTRFSIAQYKDSRLYRGTSGQTGPEAASGERASNEDRD
ncbi:putative PurR-regulated permease PerM [Rhodovulum sulfidophilum]|uniref:AI-2E family transporter n=1 Tax=Rhodovulum sulfidophilum TaxID=35806 RepID=UPI0005AA6835|nr:AI-2E family transporter [Rhodovulum sulfidophilum]ANB34993.1 AI-2E family transporter [Rhodovulum sulfidophilum DSM 1374]ANB38815.1 AI-2E family transporter [Rhodovulum sulfidophilum]MCW2305085.1 putative PurR-regulated permease PerM [Rhodovulum sulfidophilum]